MRVCVFEYLPQPGVVRGQVCNDWVSFTMSYEKKIYLVHGLDPTVSGRIPYSIINKSVPVYFIQIMKQVELPSSIQVYKYNFLLVPTSPF